jgi:hypothetical protein
LGSLSQSEPKTTEILRRAEELDQAHAREIRAKLAELGPLGLWAAVVRGWLAEHGWVESDTLSFAETMAHAVDASADERRVRVAQEQIESFLLDTT